MVFYCSPDMCPDFITRPFIKKPDLYAVRLFGPVTDRLLPTILKLRARKTGHRSSSLVQKAFFRHHAAYGDRAPL